MAPATSTWGHFRKMLDSAPLALRVPLLQARSHSDILSGLPPLLHTAVRMVQFIAPNLVKIINFYESRRVGKADLRTDDTTDGS